MNITDGDVCITGRMERNEHCPTSCVFTETAKRDIAERYTLDSIRENKLGQQEKPDYALVKATVSFIK